MTNETILIILAMLAVMDGFVLVLALVQRNMRNMGVAFNVLAGITLAMLFSEMAYYATDYPPAAEFLFNLRIPLVAFAGVGVLLLVLRYYRMDRLITPARVALLCVLPAITALVTLTSPWHGLLRQEMYLEQVTPLHLMHTVRGVWYWVHTAFVYLISAVSVGIIAVQHQKLPKGHRSPSMVLLSALCIVVACNVARVLDIIPFDIGPMCMALSLVFIFVSAASFFKSDLLVIAWDEIYNSMDQCVFIRNLSQQVVDANTAARRWLERLGVEPVFPFPYTHIFTVLRRRGATIRENAETAEGTDIYYSVDDHGVVYNLREHFVCDKAGRPIGVFSMLLDVTQYKRVIARLQKTVDIDALTGLANRRVFEEQKLRHDADGTLPLSVILGDANGLKRVNDVLGHEQGDALLRVLAGQLRAACPCGGTVARVGGDEFAMVLPGLGQSELPAIVAAVNKGLMEKAGDYPFTPSIALGAAARRQHNGQPESMDSLVRRADVNMYKDKRYDRRAPRQ